MAKQKKRGGQASLPIRPVSVPLHLNLTKTNCYEKHNIKPKKLLNTTIYEITYCDARRRDAGIRCK